MNLIKTEYLSGSGEVWINLDAIVRFRPTRRSAEGGEIVGAEVILTAGNPIDIAMTPAELAHRCDNWVRHAF